MAAQSAPPIDAADIQAEKQSIGTEIVKARELLGLTQAELATRSQVSLSAIKGYETGRNFPGAREIKQICQVLRISPNRLIFGQENPFSERAWHQFIEPGPQERKVDFKTEVQYLLPLLSSIECESFFRLAYGLALARHGLKAVSDAFRSAEAETGINKFITTGVFEAPMHAKLLVNTEVARRYAAAILVAADETDQMNARTRSS